VRTLVADYFHAGLRPDADSEDVAHRARRNEESRFAAEYFRGAGLQAVNGGVFAIDIVADFGFGHGASHRGGGPRNGVAAKINDAQRSGIWHGDMIARVFALGAVKKSQYDGNSWPMEFFPKLKTLER
jgi:hypothetical protein